jgi:hypothetical protein
MCNFKEPKKALFFIKKNKAPIYEWAVIDSIYLWVPPLAVIDKGLNYEGLGSLHRLVVTGWADDGMANLWWSAFTFVD